MAGDSVGVVTANNRLEPGDPAPDFTLPDADGNDVSLHDYRGQRVVVYFYPAAMTPGCTKQACDFRDSSRVLHGRRARGARHLARQAGQAREVPGTRRR